MNFIKEWINKIIQRNSKVNRLESNITEQEVRICNLEEQLKDYKEINNVLHDLEEHKFNRLLKRVYVIEEKLCNEYITCEEDEEVE